MRPGEEGRFCKALGVEPDWAAWEDEDWAMEEAEVWTPGLRMTLTP